MNTTAFLDHVYANKVDLQQKDFKILIGDSVLPVSPEMVAEMFACFCSANQAKFFNHIDRVASAWHGGSGVLCMQLQHITDDDGLTLAGRRVMQEIGEYSHWGLVQQAIDTAKGIQDTGATK